MPPESPEDGDEEVVEDVDETDTLLVEDVDEDVDETPPEVLVETDDEDDEESTLLTEVLDEEEEEEDDETAQHIALLTERMESTESPAVKDALQQRIEELQ